MNILTHPVTPIVAIVVVAAGVIAIVTKVASDRRKKRVFEEARRMHEKVQRQLIDEMRSKPKPRIRRPSAPAAGRPGFRTDARNTDVDHAGLFIPSLLTDYDPTPSHHHSSSNDSGSSPSSDSGSSSGSSDSGSSPSSGGCD